MLIEKFRILEEILAYILDIIAITISKFSSTNVNNESKIDYFNLSEQKSCLIRFETGIIALGVAIHPVLGGL